ncbi:hypothetical protein [Beijerinckia mobilis]|uniref:hypothetical protein n=1 Tax=Beijerinckia mobilis TaxID=231434 RepID=UPI000556F3F3|nr:hypothetical protein [Beijerinckia mobilis]
MKLDTVLARIPAWYESGLCIHLQSAPGRGKSTTIEAVPELLASRYPDKAFGIVIINGGSLTIADATGYLVPVTRDGSSYSEFTRPFWWMTAENKPLEAYDGGIVFVDEEDKLDVDVKKILGEGALSGRLGSHRIPPGWRIWTAGNRQRDRSGSTRRLDHLINRRMEIEITDDIESWIHWAVQNNVSAEAIAFTKLNPTIVFASEVPEVQGPWCTPRSLVLADRFMQALAGPDGAAPIEDPDLAIEVAGLIGVAAQRQFFAMIATRLKLPALEDILEAPEKALLPQKIDEQMLVAFFLAARAERDTIGQIIRYIERLPVDMAMAFGKAAFKRAPVLIANKEVMAWTKRNAGMINLLQYGR